MEIILTWKNEEALAIRELWQMGIMEISNPRVSVGITGYWFQDTKEVREVLEKHNLVIENLYYHFRQRGYYV